MTLRASMVVATSSYCIYLDDVCHYSSKGPASAGQAGLRKLGALHGSWRTGTLPTVAVGDTDVSSLTSHWLPPRTIARSMPSAAAIIASASDAAMSSSNHST